MSFEFKRKAEDGRVRSLRVDGYIYITANGERYLEHIFVAEKALGKPLPPGAEVHHFDGDRSNNSPGNLVICPNNAYHKLLHQRMNAMNACGHLNWRKCRYCGQYDSPTNLYINKRTVHHRSCDLKRYHQNKESSNHV